MSKRVLAPVAPVAPEQVECGKCMFMHFCSFGKGNARSPEKTGSPRKNLTLDFFVGSLFFPE
jgi:hypothetical protein